MKAANTTQLGYIDQHYRLFMIIYRLKIGYHPRVCDLMSGLFNQRSSQPNYTVMWDVKIVLEYSRNLAEDNFLLDKALTFKLVLLLTLILASRASEMTNLNFDYLPKSQSVYIFYQCKLTKT